jgi:cytidylate kinase
MNHLKMLRQFLREKRSLGDIPPTGFPFITISRQAGAGGHLLAHVITTDLLAYQDDELFRGWHVFDRELCEVIAQDPELETSMQELMAEQYRSGVAEFVESLFAGRSRQYQRQKKIFAVVRMLATMGKVIVVGRGGALVTRELQAGIHVRLVAPEAERVRWMMRKLKVEKAEALAFCREQESDRRKMARTFFNRDINDPLLYHAVFNSAVMTPHEMSACIIAMLRDTGSTAKPG